MAYNKKTKYTAPPRKNNPVNKGTVHVQQKQSEIKNNKQKLLNLFTAIFIAICACLLYSNTINHTFVLDDYSVISENKITQDGISAIPKIFNTGYREGNFTAEDNLYRPLTKAMFAVEYQLSGGKPYFVEKGGKPQLLHGVNIILYGLLCAFIFLSLIRFLPSKYYLALITTLLFTFHPIHTEVVANIKSRDEIMALFLILGSLWFAKSYVDKNKNLYLGLSIIAYFLALFAKESTITYVALLPISLYFFTNISFKKNIALTGVMLLVTSIYLVIHFSVIGSIGLVTNKIPIPDNSIMESKDFLVRKLTAIEILGRYLKLMIFPHPLSCDYSFNTIPLVKSIANLGFIFAFCAHIALFAHALKGFKKKLISSYAIFLYFITISIVSNVFMFIGTNMAERLVFIPSLGICLLVGYIIVKLLKVDKLTPVNLTEIFTKKALIWLLLIPILIAASIKTFNRNKDWKNVSTLFNQDIKTVPNSVHMILYHAGIITNSDSLAQKEPDERMKTLKFAEKELLNAAKIWEPFPNVHSLLGRVYKEMGEYYLQKQQGVVAGENYNKAIIHYQRTLQLNNLDATSYNNYATCFFALGMYDSSEVNFKRAVDIAPFCYADAIANLGSIYGTYGLNSRAKGNEVEAVKFFNMSIDMFKKTLECDYNNIQANQFLAITYGNIGDTINAKPYKLRFIELTNQKNNRLNKLKK